jgi:nitrous oxidase accessory protein NosD
MAKTSRIRNLGLPGTLAGLAVLLFGLAQPAASATHRVPDDFPTITEALEAAASGDMITVAPGVYKEAVVLKDGVILKAEAGPGETTIAYGEIGNRNEAVVTMQRCSNSTQLLGFAIDGRGLARRGVLVISDSEPVLENLVVDGAKYGVAIHTRSRPYVQNSTIQNTEVAGFFIQGGSADIRDCNVLAGQKFGVYINGTHKPVRMRDCSIEGNTQAGIQATAGEFSVYGGSVSGNGDTGIILQEVSPLIAGVVISENPNIGMVLENSSATIQSCIIRNSDFGVVASVDGQPKFYKNSFVDNQSYHLGVEGDTAPLVGGSLDNANKFLGDAAFALQTSSTAQIDATHNFWDKPCVPKRIIKIMSGSVKRKPWASADLARSFEDCTAAREFHKQWKKSEKAKAATAPPTVTLEAGSEADDAATEAPVAAEAAADPAVEAEPAAEPATDTPPQSGT